MQRQTPEHWLEIRWHLTTDHVEEFQILLEQYGSLGSYENIALNDKDEPVFSDTRELIAYFSDQPSLENLANQIKNLETEKRKLITINRIPQGNWATEWKKYFKPFFLTPQIVIRPSWEPYDRKGKEKIITIDPGMAFGTGQHDTTRFCAEFLCELREQHSQLNSLIDVGCGSGILSILAKYIGFKTVTGLDLEEAAIEAAVENLEKNPQANPVVFCLNHGPINTLGLEPADVVVANIIAETIVDLKLDLCALVKPEGFLVLSGIMAERRHLIEAAFSTLSLVHTKSSKDWYAYLYCKK